MSASEPRLIVRDLRKAFGETRALVGVDLTVARGEVHALIGENGAGKSTLLKILAGVESPDGGTIALDGKSISIRSPIEARAAGVAMVHQELSLCPHLTVEENVLLGDEPTRFGLVRRDASRARAKRALAEVGTALDPSARVADLSPAAQQLVEIARAIAHPSARVLILDEPTSSLGHDDAERLITLVRSLAARGRSILYVSHFLEEVQQVADRYTVLRDGSSVGEGDMQGADLGDIVQRMVGRTIDELFPCTERTRGEAILEVRELAGVVKPTRASFTLHRGEVLGVAGLVGAGRTEMLRAIFRLDRVMRGEVKVSAPMGLLSEDRKGEGLAVGRSIAENLTLSNLGALGRFGFVSPRKERAITRGFFERLSIKARDPDQPVGDLSGGNQQKVAFARLLHQDADVLLLDEPTRGVDVGSKAQIYALIDALAKRGKAILIVSSYLPELLGVCDRIAVMRRGVLGEAHEARAVDGHALLTEATLP